MKCELKGALLSVARVNVVVVEPAARDPCKRRGGSPRVEAGALAVKGGPDRLVPGKVAGQALEQFDRERGEPGVECEGDEADGTGAQRAVAAPGSSRGTGGDRPMTGPASQS